MAPLWLEHGLEPRPYGGAYEHLYLDIYPPGLAAGDAAHVGTVQSIRPAAGEARKPVESEPLVYVTFGTVFEDLTLLRTIVEGVRELPVRVLVTVGPNGDPDALGVQPENVEVARYVPQAEVLPRCAAVVSHGGSGTFLAALAHGLPQLIVPQGADQYLNAQALARSGAGLVLAPDAASAQAAHDATRPLLDEPEHTEAAQRIAAQIADMPAPDEVAALLADRFGER
jgi:MGT family glycosyltransferase